MFVPSRRGFDIFMNSATDAAGIPSKSTAIISGVEASACFATSYTAVSDWAGVLRARWASANFFASAADENSAYLMNLSL